MRYRLLVPGIVLAFATLLSSVALACGDKLMLSFGTLRYGQVKGPIHPAVILAYAHADSAVAGMVKELESGSALKQSGHKLNIVEDAVQLEEALGTGKYDLLLVDAADADTLQQEAQSAPSMPSVLPVVYRSTKADANQIEKKFHRVLKVPGSPERYLETIEQAMASRSKPSRAPAR